MHIAFFYESGSIDEIGMGHMYRSREIARHLEKSGHQITLVAEGNNLPKADVLVVDHIHTQKKLIEEARSLGMKIVLIDGAPDDADIADVSISAFVNPKATYTGAEYLAFPTNSSEKGYNGIEDAIFVGMGGFDRNNLAQIALEAIGNLNLQAVVTKSINHKDLGDIFRNVEVFDGENYYDAMRKCRVGITNGGLTMFQALHYGLPCIAVPQYEHQQVNIDNVSDYCETCEPDAEKLERRIIVLMRDEAYRKHLSEASQYYIDGNGPDRICKIIEDLV